MNKNQFDDPLFPYMISGPFSQFSAQITFNKIYGIYFTWKHLL